MDAKKFIKIREAVDSLQRRADKAQGAADQILNTLRSEFGVDTPQEGEDLLKKLEKERDDLDKELEKLWKDFEKEYGDLVNY